MKRLSELQFTSDFVAEECIKCFAPFALSKEHYRLRQGDHKLFWCPACGNSMHYTGENQLQRDARVAREEAATARREAADMRSKLTAVGKQYMKIRDRIRNGLCPCCRRNFSSLGEHIRKEHPHFGDNETLKSVRELFGMTQGAAADEIGVNPGHVSHASGR